jgi:hypothetical protein
MKIFLGLSAFYVHSEPLAIFALSNQLIKGIQKEKK